LFVGWVTVTKPGSILSFFRECSRSGGGTGSGADIKALVAGADDKKPAAEGSRL
jgi:hypothetical protein